MAAGGSLANGQWGTFRVALVIDKHQAPRPRLAKPFSGLQTNQITRKMSRDIKEPTASGDKKIWRLRRWNLVEKVP